MSDRWLFITVGVGNKDFEAAADRVAVQAERFGIFAKTLSVKTEEVFLLTPELTAWFTKEELLNSRGYGWFVWKSRIVKMAMAGHWGEFDGIVFSDAGCELYLSIFSKRRFIKYLENAKVSGCSAFSLNTPEWKFSKQYLFSFYPTLDSRDSSPQFQSNFFVLHGSSGRKISEKWNMVSSHSPLCSNEVESKSGELDGFYCHRHDQSILSLTIKELGISALKSTPPGDSLHYLSLVKKFFYPVWWARNRTGTSVIPVILSKLGIQSLLLAKAKFK